MATTVPIPFDGPGAPRAGARRRYTLVAIVLHWLIALAVLANLYLGWRMAGAEGVQKFTLFQLHKSVGITVLLLSLLRLGWRLTHSPPPYPASMMRAERFAARSVHWIFYGLIIGMPLTGWVIVSASALNIPTLLYGAVHDLPLAGRHAVEQGFGTSHVVLAYLFAGLIALHVAAALKHQFVNRDEVLGHMVPGVEPAPRDAGPRGA